MSTLQQLLPGVKTDIFLAPYTQLGVGGKAEYFFLASSAADVKKAEQAAKDVGIPSVVIEEGENVLFPDSGFHGLVILHGDGKEEKKKEAILTAPLFHDVVLKKGKLACQDEKQGTPTEFLQRELPKHYIDEGKIAATWLVKAFDFRGKTMGKAMISADDANVVVNMGGAKAEHVIMLMSLIKQKVRDEFGIQLQEKIQLVGF